MDYLLLKWIHIISSTILFGTGIGSAFFMFMANRSGDFGGIYFATRFVVIADWLFTTPAVIIQLVTGYLLADTLGYSLFEGWVFWALILYMFIGVCWLPVVWIQIKMRNMAIFAKNNGIDLPPQYWQLEKLWTLLGTLAFPAVLVIFYLMVFKPI